MRRKSVPLATVREVTADPCAVCGVPYETQCDHVVAVAAGGSNDRSNLQSLCSQCNKIKHADKSNLEVAAIVLARGRRHFEVAVWRHDTRFLNPYSRPALDEWMAANPGRAAFASKLQSAFLLGVA